ncbi:hypothetical protein LZ30DRAFT_727505 [Colletotrichum cereale]|nr:hypothetical protein LZ30DRAFT_727505 [Colletotrichum cereale]
MDGVCYEQNHPEGLHIGRHPRQQVVARRSNDEQSTAVRGPAQRWEPCFGCLRDPGAEPEQQGQPTGWGTQCLQGPAG